MFISSFEKVRFFILSFVLLNVVARPQWKAAIDLKWIRDNKADVAQNIIHRNSVANLDLVLELYDRMLNLQKVRVLLLCCNFFFLIC